MAVVSCRQGLPQASLDVAKALKPTLRPRFDRRTSNPTAPRNVDNGLTVDLEIKIVGLGIYE
jgi:hypothetical protein